MLKSFEYLINEDYKVEFKNNVFICLSCSNKYNDIKKQENALPKNSMFLSYDYVYMQTSAVKYKISNINTIYVL